MWRPNYPDFVMERTGAADPMETIRIVITPFWFALTI
jgi:hypothetical protein